MTLAHTTEALFLKCPASIQVAGQQLAGEIKESMIETRMRDSPASCLLAGFSPSTVHGHTYLRVRS